MPAEWSAQQSANKYARLIRSFGATDAASFMAAYGTAVQSPYGIAVHVDSILSTLLTAVRTAERSAYGPAQFYAVDFNSLWPAFVSAVVSSFESTQWPTDVESNNLSSFRATNYAAVLAAFCPADNATYGYALHVYPVVAAKWSANESPERSTIRPANQHAYHLCPFWTAIGTAVLSAQHPPNGTTILSTFFSTQRAAYGDSYCPAIFSAGRFSSTGHRLQRRLSRGLTGRMIGWLS